MNCLLIHSTSDCEASRPESSGQNLSCHNYRFDLSSPHIESESLVVTLDEPETNILSNMYIQNEHTAPKEKCRKRFSIKRRFRCPKRFAKKLLPSCRKQNTDDEVSKQNEVRCTPSPYPLHAKWKKRCYSDDIGKLACSVDDEIISQCSEKSKPVDDMSVRRSEWVSRVFDNNLFKSTTPECDSQINSMVSIGSFEIFFLLS